MIDHHDISRDACMLHGPLASCGYDWWWHSFTAQDAETGEDKAFFIEFFVCNPALAEEEPVLGQLPENKAAGKRPSYLMSRPGPGARITRSCIGSLPGKMLRCTEKRRTGSRRETVWPARLR